MPINNSNQVATEHERLTSLINSMADGVIAIDQDKKIVMSNGAVLNILDINSSLRSKSLGTVLKLFNTKDERINLNRIINELTTPYSTRDWRIKYNDGSFANLYVSIAPVRLGYGNEGMKGFVLLLRDISQEKSLEEERNEFISVISHELRTPIAIAEGNIGNAELLFRKSGIHNPIIHDSLKQAYSQIIFLSGLVNDLATLSRAERGKLTLEVEQINVVDLLDDLRNNYIAEAEAKGLGLHVKPDANLESLSSSRLYVREILQNFITNAIKYTDKGGVTVSAKPTDGGTVFEVSDTGIGISKTDQERVFDKFFRSEDFRTRQNNGTGLGLYVTSKLSKLIQGKLELKSTLNSGSTFKIYIPNIYKD